MKWRAFILIELLVIIGTLDDLLLSALDHFKGGRQADSLRWQLETNCSGGIFVYGQQFGLIASS